MDEYISKQIEKILAFRKALSSESDRGCALLAASFLDNALSDLMYVSFVYNKKIEKDLLNGTAPLATFSSRIDMAYYLGKIPKSCKSDLHIRAHSHFPGYAAKYEMCEFAISFSWFHRPAL
jgi:DNA-binding MltR family transcriptional regulator